jgi:tetratricopeptide (TPR) repeat protein
MVRTVCLILVLAASAATLAACTTPRPPDAIRARGDLEFKRGNYAAAAEEYGELAERYPGDWRAQHRLGLSLMETGDLAGARRALEIAHTRQPGDVDVADALAEVMFRQEDEQPLFAFLRERAEATQSVHAYRRLARYAMEMGDPDSARRALDTAILIDGGQTIEPYLDAADFAERLGEMDVALRRLRQAYGINPHDRRVRDRLAALGEVPGPTLALPPGR